ncbi:MAG: hypothetical protein WBM75_04770 [Polyangiales bacterium]
MAKTTNDLDLVQESGAGKMFNTGDEQIQVLQLRGSWYEMGQQYGAFAKGKLQPLWDSQVQPVLDKKWMSEAEALEPFCLRVLPTGYRVTSQRPGFGRASSIAERSRAGRFYERGLAWRLQARSGGRA